MAHTPSNTVWVDSPGGQTPSRATLSHKKTHLLYGTQSPLLLIVRDIQPGDMTDDRRIDG